MYIIMYIVLLIIGFTYVHILDLYIRSYVYMVYHMDHTEGYHDILACLATYSEMRYTSDQ